MNKTFLLLFSVILLIGLVSATPLQEFMSSSDLTVYMTQDSTTNVFSMNTAGLSFDNQTIQLPVPFNGYSTINVPISGILNGINLRMDLSGGSTYPTFSQVSISSTPSLEIFPEVLSSEKALLNLLLNQISTSTFTGEVTQDSQVLTNLASQNPFPVPAQGNSYFVKNGNTYTFGYSEGFGAVQSDYKNKIGEAIVRGVNSMNVQTLISETLLPSISLETYLPVLQQLGYNVSQENIDFANALLHTTDYSGANYDVSVDLTTLAFQDGTYQIPVTITPLVGDTNPIIKTITLVLDGVVNEAGEETTDNTYVPTDFGVKKVIKSIVGLTVGTIINVQVSDDKPITVNVLNHVEGLKYLIIDVDQQPAVNAQISFSIDKVKISHSNKVSLYLWEPTSSSWTKLTTIFVRDNGAEYEYTATTPHFSTFMVGEDTTSSSSRNSNIGSTTLGGDSSITTPVPATPEPTPINLESPTQEGFFARLGRFLTTLTGGVISGNDAQQNSTIGVAGLLTFLIALTGIGLIAVRARR